MSAQDTPGAIRVNVDGRTCEVFNSADGAVRFVRLVLRTKGDSHNTRRTLRLDGPMARAAVAKATGATS